jgi:hypothetical protein
MAREITRESDLQRAIRLAVGRSPDAVLWRNNVGFAAESRVRYGLCSGSSDLIGLSRTGRFLAIEIKAHGGRLTDEQTAFLDLVRRMGGVSGVARSVEDAMRLVEEACS